MQLEVLWQHGAFTVSTRGLQVQGDPTREEWLALAVRLARTQTSVAWALADYAHLVPKAYGSTFDEAEKITGAANKSLRNGRALAKEFPLSRRRDKLSISHHDAVCGLDRADQDRLLDQAVAEGLSLRDLRTLVRDANRKHRERPWPEGRYGVIYADPPWKYADGPGGFSPENHYPTMETEAICALPVADRATDDCALYLWATNKHLPDALQVLTAWGFTYTTNLAWVKPSIGLGAWTRARHELLLIGTRGAIAPPDVGDRPDSVIEAPRREHSRKPDEVYALIERAYPAVPKVELFARRARPGWATWGNELLNEEAA